VTLDDKPYLLGEVPTAVDGFAYGVLSNLLVPVFDTALRGRIECHPCLTAYVERMSQQFFSR
jgi:glutathione S-transferase